MTVEGARPAVAGDLPRMVELCMAAEEELAAVRGGALRSAGRRLPVAQGLSAALEGEESNAWVGLLDQVVVGLATGHLVNLADGRWLGTITDLVVEPEARGVGVGAALVDAAVSWFEIRGCVGVDTTALPGHRETKSFLEGQGFKARLLVMHRESGGI